MKTSTKIRRMWNEKYHIWRIAQDVGLTSDDVLFELVEMGLVNERAVDLIGKNRFAEKPIRKRKGRAKC